MRIDDAGNGTMPVPRTVSPKRDIPRTFEDAVNTARKKQAAGDGGVRPATTNTGTSKAEATDWETGPADFTSPAFETGEKKKAPFIGPVINPAYKSGAFPTTTQPVKFASGIPSTIAAPETPPPATPPQVTVDNDVIRALKPAQATARTNVTNADTKLDGSKAKTQTTQQQLDALNADIDVHGASASKLARAERLRTQLEAERGKVKTDQKAYDAANAKLNAINTALYSEQLKADQAKAEGSGTTAKNAYSDYVKTVPKGTEIKQGETLSDEQVATLRPDQRAAYFKYLKAQMTAADDQNKVNATTIELNRNYAQWQVYASDPAKYGNIARDALMGINDALRPLNLEMQGPDKIDPKTATQNLAELDRLAPYYFALWSASSSWSSAYGDVVDAQILYSDALKAHQDWRADNPHLQAPGSTTEIALNQAEQKLYGAMQKAEPLLLDYSVKSTYASKLQGQLGVQDAQKVVSDTQAKFNQWHSAHPNIPASDNPYADELTKAREDLALVTQQAGLADLDYSAALAQQTASNEELAAKQLWTQENGNTCFASGDGAGSPTFIVARDRATAARERADTLSLDARQKRIDFEKTLAEQDVALAQAAVDKEKGTTGGQPEFVLVGYSPDHGNGSAPPPTQAEIDLANAQKRMSALQADRQQIQYMVELNSFLNGLPEHLKNPQTDEHREELKRKQYEFYRIHQFNQGEPIDGDTALEQVKLDLANQQKKLDNRGWMHSAVDGVNEGVGGDRSWLETYIQGHESKLTALNADRGSMTEEEYQAALQELMQDYGQNYVTMSNDEVETDGVWNNVNEISRFAVATTVGIAATVAGGGVNVIAGAAAGFAVYQAWDSADDATVAIKGGDMTADGHLSIAGFTGRTVDTVQGDVSWGDWRDSAKLAGQDLAMNTVSSFATAGGVGLSVWTSAFVAARGLPAMPLIGTRLGQGALQIAPKAAPFGALRSTAALNSANSITTRLVSTSAGLTSTQAVMGSGQFVNTAIGLGFDGKLDEAEGRQTLLRELKNQGIYLAAAPLVGLGAGALPHGRIFMQAMFDMGTNYGQEILRAQLVDGRFITFEEGLGAFVGTIPGTAMNLASRGGAAADYRELTPADRQDRVDVRAEQIAKQAGRPVEQADRRQAIAEINAPIRARAKTLWEQAGKPAGGSGKFLDLADMELRLEHMTDRLWQLDGKTKAKAEYEAAAKEHLRVQDLAYNLWKDAGAPTGREFVFWKQAKHQLHIEGRAKQLWEADHRAKPLSEYEKQAVLEAGYFKGQLDWPDIRLSGSGRARPVKSRQTPGETRTTVTDVVGAPTLASTGFAVGTRSSLKALGRSLIDSWHLVSFSPWRAAWNENGQVSIRPIEYKNLPLNQMGVYPLSNQTAFQLKASAFVKTVKDTLVNSGDTPKFATNIRAAKTVGADLTVVQLNVSFGLKATDVTLSHDETDLLGTPGTDKNGFVQLTESAPYNKVLTEKKIAMPRIFRHWLDARDIALLKPLAIRWGIEVRPELPLPGGLPKGATLSKLIFDQNQSALGQVNVKVQVKADSPATAAKLVEDVKQGRITDLAGLKSVTGLDLANTVTFVPSVQSGMRLSAIPGKLGHTEITDLTGKRRTVWHPDQTNVDILFNDRYHSKWARNIPNPDRLTNRALYPLQRLAARTGLAQRLANTPLQWLHSPDAPQPHATATPHSLWTPFRDANPAAPNRMTLALYFRPFFRVPTTDWSTTTTEGRVMLKTDPDAAKPRNRARMLQDDQPVTLTKGYPDPSAGSGVTSLVQVTVPSWLKTALSKSGRGEGFILPAGGKDRSGNALAGGKQPLLDALDELKTAAPSSEHARIDQLRADAAKVKEGAFLPPALARQFAQEFGL